MERGDVGGGDVTVLFGCFEDRENHLFVDDVYMLMPSLVFYFFFL